MTTPEDTRPGRHNTGDGAPTDAELINYLADVDRSVSLTQLTERLGVTREQLKARIESLEDHPDIDWETVDRIERVLSLG